MKLLYFKKDFNFIMNFNFFKEQKIRDLSFFKKFKFFYEFNLIKRFILS